MNSAAKEHGTMVIAALLLLVLLFAAYWIATAVTGADPRGAIPWFGLAAVTIIVVGILTYVRSGGYSGGRGGPQR